MGSWTPELLAQLQEHATAGRSAGKIATLLGKTRNSVLGKVWRLGITLLNSQTRGWAQPQLQTLKALWIAGHTPAQIAEKLGNMSEAAVRAKIDRIVQRRAAHAARERDWRARRPIQPHAELRASRAISRSALAAVVGIKLVDLKSDHCRFVVGEIEAANTLYCGSPVEHGKSWCGAHCAVVFNPLTR
jgi:hypothetical protein